ncbi:MAG: hypothetical protein C0490_01645 [Marivirga sp.]|nr:hypothetical protein [Marivirga sp.]
MIKDEFLTALRNYTTRKDFIHSLWTEVETKYSEPGRHYHNLAHLNSVTRELLPFKKRFTDWNTITFAIAYHDIVYHTLKNNNEEKSAGVAMKRLSALACPEKLISDCKELILATKKHQVGDEGTNLFTDADLSILGSDPETYKTYCRQIRREYSLYPDFVYNPGRKKVLIHFLEMSTIFKSPEFGDKYESSARINLQEELRSLQ